MTEARAARPFRHGKIRHDRRPVTYRNRRRQPYRGRRPRRPRQSVSCAARNLLRSLINYWQNHPALSYLFSGMFVGPTSQAPRIDEARNDSLYELEIAFKEIERAGPDCPYWLIDRTLSNLADRRARATPTAPNSCIDKLYSPVEQAQPVARGWLSFVSFRNAAPCRR